MAKTVSASILQFMADPALEAPPKDLSSILNACLAVRRRRKSEPEIKTPLMTLSLAGGHAFHGRVTDCNFETRHLTFLVATPEGSMDICYTSFDAVQALTIHDLNLHPEFFQELYPSSS